MVNQDLVWSAASVAMTIGGPFLFIGGLRAWRVKRLIQDTPSSRIRSMAMGLVELHGKVEERSRVNAPFSGRECAYWEVEIATRSSNNRDSTRTWHTVHRNRSGNPFFLRDDTGVALVYPQGAECRLPFGVEEETQGFGVPDCYMEYMTAQGLALRGVWSLGHMRFRERVLEDGVGVFVLGRAFPRAMATTVSWDEEALEATGTDAHATSRVRSLDGEVRGVVRRGPQDPAFLISPQSEKDMTFEFGLRAFAGVAGGPALSLFGVWCLIELAKSGQLFR